MKGAKRAFDLTVALLLLAILFPLLVLVALLVRIYLQSPILFRQRRPGLLGRSFTLLKFRTMTDARDSEGKLLPDEQRLTHLGAFLRSTSLDELPSLINIVLGEMSIVGPRPLLMRYLDRYTPEQMRRHEVRPGLTGWAQIHGRNAITWEEKFELDVWYVDHMSLGLDLRILMLTVWKVLKREGINPPELSATPEFMGTSDQKPP